MELEEMQLRLKSKLYMRGLCKKGGGESIKHKTSVPTTEATQWVSSVCKVKIKMGDGKEENPMSAQFLRFTKR